MAISMNKYVDIKSGINNIKTATEKELIVRIFTKEMQDASQVYEFENASEVGDFFGREKAEYQIAQKYFAFINKYSRSPKKIGFYSDWRDGIKSSMRAQLSSATLADLKLVTAGAIRVTIGEISKTISSIDLSSATSFEDVASTIQTAIREADEDESFTDASFMSYSNDDDNYFALTAGTNGKNILLIGGANDSNLVDLLGFVENNPFLLGRPEGTITEVFDESYQISNNFATFAFINDQNNSGVVVSSKDDMRDIGEHINSKYPSEFMLVVPVLEENYEDIKNEVENINGVSLELCDREIGTEYNYVLPMAITATTDYNKENGTVDYMYTQDNNIGVVVDEDNIAKNYDSAKVNYYGRTQQAGQKLAFYQNGVLQGNYQDQNIYVNEIWLKDALTTKFINYMLLTSNWFANKAGQSIGQGLIMDIIERAKLNGTITTEKEISEADKVYIYNITSDENAWRQIYQLGYYLITSIDKVEINNQQTYQFTYTLLYSKGDSIKKVEGQNILI